MVAKSSPPLIQLMGVLPVLPAPFPTLNELTTHTVGSTSTSSDTRGLFSSLVGDPAVLLDDLLRDPKKYEPGVETLLQELLSGQKMLANLDMDDRSMLDRATLDLNRSSSPEQKPTSVKEASVPLEPPKTEEPEELDLTELEPYWFDD